VADRARLALNRREFRAPQVRFDFRAGYGEMARLLTLPIVLVPLTLGLLYPYYAYRKRRFFLEHSTFGTTPFAFDASAEPITSCISRRR